MKKILRYGDVPGPGDLRNLIKVSLAFSDPDDPYDYLRQLFIRLYGDILVTDGRKPPYFSEGI